MAGSYMDSQATYVDRDAMVGLTNVISTVADTRTMTIEESNSVVIATKTSATQTFTLPTVQTGLTYTFICDNAASEILINPTGSVVFNIKASEGGASVVTAAGTGIKNTAATNVKSDRITLVSDGTAWYSALQSGIWASQ